MKKFPNLKLANFLRIDNLSDTALKTFITLNPQIENLHVTNCKNLTLSIYNRISIQLSNLTQLNIESKKPMTISEYNELVMQLSQLKYLRYLEIIIYHSYSANILIDSFVTNLSAIETLRLIGFDHDFEKNGARIT